MFSLFEGKRFDLGLYEAGTTRVVRFDRVGVSYIFCNIHPGMSAVVVALKTPYYGVSNAQGKIVIEHVPPGRYTMQVWADRASLGYLRKLNREVAISDSDQSLGVVPNRRRRTSGAAQEQIRPGLRCSGKRLSFFGSEVDPLSKPGS